ncbi:translocation protein TolB, partial [Candidatus Bathyarchaeota archaeon]
MSLTLAVILSISLIISSTYLTQTTFQRNNGKIAFNSDRDGNFEIYVMNADGSNVTRLTNNSDYDTVPWWSPDG